jgi:hypothetical protein
MHVPRQSSFHTSTSTSSSHFFLLAFLFVSFFFLVSATHTPVLCCTLLFASYMASASAPLAQALAAKDDVALDICFSGENRL